MISWLRRLLDAWRHPGEYQQQRIRRRMLEGIRLAEADRRLLDATDELREQVTR